MSISTPRAGHGRNAPAALDLHPGVYVAALAGWVWLFGAFWATFGGEAEGAFMLGVDMVFLAAFFGVPYAMKRTADRFLNRHDRAGSFADFLQMELETLTGLVSGWSALIQVCIVPFALALGMTAIGIIIAAVRAPYI
ncbi:MAG: hypothetical protein K8R18_16550 [Parvibaculum sp.]|uniref:hypothetical protein n=1 Tax=Parvibaculum sp. TaxID=2024848 RepID=UPI0025F25546|nr:hypothetical protein [Parvibaculum sp.]MCE9651231.1 hypothetical protein [Parvibaculum sp.]